MMIRSLLTVFIWVLSSVISLIVLALGLSSDTFSSTELIFMFGLPLVVAMFGTVAIWEASKDMDKPAPQEKNKRQQLDKLGLLMELMDEDERYAFKEVLKRQVLAEAAYADDGEIPLDVEEVARLRSRR